MTLGIITASKQCSFKGENNFAHWNRLPHSGTLEYYYLCTNQHITNLKLFWNKQCNGGSHSRHVYSSVLVGCFPLLLIYDQELNTVAIIHLLTEMRTGAKQIITVISARKNNNNKNLNLSLFFCSLFFLTSFFLTGLPSCVSCQCRSYV